MITKEQIQTLDDRALKWYRKHITQFHQECLEFERCFQGDPENVFHQHFKELEQMLFDEIQRRTDAHKVDGVLGMHPQTLYEMAEKLAPDEAMRLLQASETEDERKFYAYIVNMNLQRKQKEVIEKKLF